MSHASNSSEKMSFLSIEKGKHFTILPNGLSAITNAFTVSNQWHSCPIQTQPKNAI